MKLHVLTIAAPAPDDRRADRRMMETVYEMCIDRTDGTSEPRLIEADNSSHALSLAFLDPSVDRAAVV